MKGSFLITTNTHNHGVYLQKKQLVPSDFYTLFCDLVRSHERSRKESLQKKKGRPSCCSPR